MITGFLIRSWKSVKTDKWLHNIVSVINVTKLKLKIGSYNKFYVICILSRNKNKYKKSIDKLCQKEDLAAWGQHAAETTHRCSAWHPYLDQAWQLALHRCQTGVKPTLQQGPLQGLQWCRLALRNHPYEPWNFFYYYFSKFFKIKTNIRIREMGGWNTEKKKKLSKLLSGPKNYVSQHSKKLHFSNKCWSHALYLALEEAFSFPESGRGTQGWGASQEMTKKCRHIQASFQSDQEWSVFLKRKERDLKKSLLQPNLPDDLALTMLRLRSRGRDARLSPGGHCSDV